MQRGKKGAGLVAFLARRGQSFAATDLDKVASRAYRRVKSTAHFNAHLFVSTIPPSFSSIRIIYPLLNGPHNTFTETFR